MARYNRGPGRRRFGLDRFLGAAKKALVLSGPEPVHCLVPWELAVKFFLSSHLERFGEVVSCRF